jgi:hypothetical protein
MLLCFFLQDKSPQSVYFFKEYKLYYDTCCLTPYWFSKGLCQFSWLPTVPRCPLSSSSTPPAAALLHQVHWVGSPSVCCVLGQRPCGSPSQLAGTAGNWCRPSVLPVPYLLSHPAGSVRQELLKTKTEKQIIKSNQPYQ